MKKEAVTNGVFLTALVVIATTIIVTSEIFFVSRAMTSTGISWFPASLAIFFLFLLCTLTLSMGFTMIGLCRDRIRLQYVTSLFAHVFESDPDVYMLSAEKCVASMVNKVDTYRPLIEKLSDEQLARLRGAIVVKIAHARARMLPHSDSADIRVIGETIDAYRALDAYLAEFMRTPSVVHNMLPPGA